jgi:predicted RNA polymerase sigma factor
VLTVSRRRQISRQRTAVNEDHGLRLRRSPSPVVELNRAVAVGMAYGPGKGLEIADALTGEPALAGYVQLPAVRGDLLARLGRLDEARAEFTRAAALTSNERERALFRARAAECGAGDG